MRIIFCYQHTHTHLHKKSEHKSRHNTTYLNLGNKNHGGIVIFADNILDGRLNLGLMRSKLRDKISIHKLKNMESRINEKWNQSNYIKSDVCCVTNGYKIHINRIYLQLFWRTKRKHQQLNTENSRPRASI